MDPRHSPDAWDQRYREGDLPWDARRPEPRLTEVIETLEAPTDVAIDLGCGTGDNAFFLALRGYRVLGVDVAARAVEIARERAAEQRVGHVRFEEASVTQPLPIEAGSAGLAIDRGCFHVLDEADRPAMAEQVAAALAADGWWVLICGNADEDRPEGVVGPPQLRAAQVVEPVEAFFQIHHLERTRFSGSHGQPTHLAWRMIARKR